MSVLGDLIIRVSANIDGLNEALKTVVQKVDEMGDKVESRLASIESVGARMAGAGALLTAGLTLPLEELGKHALETAISFEQTKIAFTTLLHSATEGDALLKNLYAFAAQTPFQIGGILQASRNLLSLGFSAKEVVPIMRTLGDAASGLGRGQEGLERLVYDFGRIQSSGHITGRIIQEMAQIGVAAGPLLAEGLGKPIAEVTKMVENKMIDANTAITLLRQGLDRHFGGGMEAQMKSLGGMLSNFKDQVTYTLNDIGQQLLPFAKVFVDVGAKVLEAVKGMAEGFGNLPEPVKDLIVSFALMAATIGPLLAGVGGLAWVLGALGAAFAPIAAVLGVSVVALGSWALVIAAAVAAAGALAYWTYVHWNSIKAVTVQVWTAIVEFLKPIWSTIANAFGDWGNAIKSLWGGTASAIWETTKAVFGEMVHTISDAISGIVWGFQKLKEIVMQIPGLKKLLDTDVSGTWKNSEKTIAAATVTTKAHTEAVLHLADAHDKLKTYTWGADDAVQKFSESTLKNFLIWEKTKIERAAALVAFKADMDAMNKGDFSGLIANMDAVAKAQRPVVDGFKILAKAAKIKVSDTDKAKYGKENTKKDDPFPGLSESMNNHLGAILRGAQTFRQAWAGLVSDMVQQWEASLVKMAVKWAIHQAAKLILHIATNQGIVASDAAAALQSLAIMYAKHLKSVFMAAKEAAAKAYAAYAEIPPLAAIVAAATFVGVMAIGAVSAERGAVLPNRETIGMLHPEEMVLPRNISKGLQSMFSGSGASGAGGNTYGDTNVHYHGTGPLTESALNQHADALVRIFKGRMRANAI